MDANWQLPKTVSGPPAQDGSVLGLLGKYGGNRAYPSQLELLANGLKQSTPLRRAAEADGNLFPAGGAYPARFATPQIDGSTTSGLLGGLAAPAADSAAAAPFVSPQMNLGSSSPDPRLISGSPQFTGDPNAPFGYAPNGKPWTAQDMMGGGGGNR
jgi:hypothetical protein